MSRFPKLGTSLNPDFRNSYNEGIDKIDDELDSQKQFVEDEMEQQKQRVDNLIAEAEQPSEVVDARGNHTILRDRLDSTDAQLAQTTQHLSDIADLFLVNFRDMNETTWDNAIQRAIESVTEDRPIKITFPRGSVKLNAVLTRRKNLEISGHGTTLIPTNTTEWMWTHYGDYFTVKGFKVEQDSVGDYRGFKVLNDVTTRLSSYAYFKEVTMIDLYQALEFYCESGLGGASYRHTIEKVYIRNYIETQTRAGSFGLKFGGNVSSDAAGNDTKVFNTFIKGYEKNLIVQNSTGTKFTLCGIDGGGIAIELDSGSYHTFNQCYIEYNDTFLNLVNTPYRPMFVASTIANYNTYITGSLYGNEHIIESATTSPQIRKMDRTVGVYPKTLIRTGMGHGAGFFIDNDQKALDFVNAGGGKIGLVPSDDMDMYYSINPGYKSHFGDISGGSFSSFDNLGNLETRRVANKSVTTLTQDGSRPYADSSNMFVTNNTVATTITEFRGGVLGQIIHVKANDSNTTISNGTYIKTKTGSSIALTSGQVVSFGMFESGVFTQIN